MNANSETGTRTETDPADGALPPAKNKTRRSGIALVIVLGFLTLMTIMAISFSINMRTERLSSGLYKDAAQYSHLIHVATARALSDIDADLQWTIETRAGVQRYTDTPMAPAWRDRVNGDVINVMVSTGTASTVDLTTGTALDYMPDQAAADEARMQAAAWMPIEVDGQVIGRYAYAAVDCSGLLDCTAVGKKARAPFEADSRGIPLSYELLGEFANAGQVTTFQNNLSNKWHRIETMPELRRALSEAGAGSPSNVFYFSYTPPDEWFDQYYQIVRPRVAWGTNLASVVANREAIRNGFMLLDRSIRKTAAGYVSYWDKPGTFGNNSFQTDTSANDRFNRFFSCLTDYLDTDASIDQANLKNLNNETTPQISEVIFSNRIASVAGAGTSGEWWNQVTVYVEIAFPHPVFGVSRNYSLEVDLTTAGNLPVNIANAKKDLNANGPRDHGRYPNSATWLPNEYRVWVNSFAVEYHETLPTIPRRRPTYTATVRIRDKTTGDLVDIAENITMDSKDIMTDKSVTWDGSLTCPVDVKGIASKTPGSETYSEVSNWEDNKYQLRQLAYRPGYTDNWSNSVTPGFFNVNSFLEMGDTSGVNTWLAYSRSQDRLDHVSEVFRIPTIVWGATSTGFWNFFSLTAYESLTSASTSTRYVRDVQFYDRFTTSTNRPSRGYINPNSRNSNVLAAAYYNLPYQWYAGIDGFLYRAINPDYPTAMSWYQFQFNPYSLNALSALNFGRKLLLNRDVDLTSPLRGPQGLASDSVPDLHQRTTYQFIGWHDLCVINWMKHYEKFGLWPLPNNVHHSGVFPHRQSVENQSCDMGRAWQTSHWLSDTALPYPAPREYPNELCILQPRPSYDVTAIGAEGYLHAQTFHSQFSETMNPRQNLFTILVAAQAVAPQAVGSSITDDEVLSERRAVMVVWRDPWPTAPDGETDSETYNKAKRIHKTRLVSFTWLDE